MYEQLSALVDVGEDCTVGIIDTNIADFRSRNTEVAPVAAYWVAVADQLESIR